MSPEVALRPAYRYALAAGVATLVAVVAALRVSVTEGVDPTAPPVEAREGHVRKPVRPEGLEPLEAPVVGDPGPESRTQLLDDIEVFETERFGAAEAARRRQAREQMLDDRMEDMKRRDH